MDDIAIVQLLEMHQELTHQRAIHILELIPVILNTVIQIHPLKKHS